MANFGRSKKRGETMKFRSIPQVKNSVVSSLAVFLLTLPIVCAAQEKIIFTSNRSGNGDIYSMKPDGTLPTQLTIDAAVDHEPSVSFDGSRIVFTSQRDFQSSDLEEIYIMNADGSNQTRLTNNFLKDFEPAISPDGTRIAFVQAPFQIFIMNADGTSPTALVPGFDPSFSSDGSKIIYSAFGNTSYEIFTINLDGTNRTQITQNASFDGHPKFSPDGRRIAFVSDRDGEAAVYIMNVDGTDQLRLASIFTDPFNTWGLSCHLVLTLLESRLPLWSPATSIYILSARTALISCG
jgi:Tol biopolymer transport system component